MPSRNIVKSYDTDAYYHVYNRGVEKRAIFLDDQDYAVFKNLLKRYLGSSIQKDKFGREFTSFSNVLELNVYCLMPNHFHMLIYTIGDGRVMADFMKRLCASYTIYFNKKYKRVGHLFQGNYKASHIISDTYLQHISRYIHLNPNNPDSWPYSSLCLYLGSATCEWVNSTRLQGLFKGGAVEYAEYMQDYAAHKLVLEDLKYELANNLE